MDIKIISIYIIAIQMLLSTSMVPVPWNSQFNVIILAFPLMLLVLSSFNTFLMYRHRHIVQIYIIVVCLIGVMYSEFFHFHNLFRMIAPLVIVGSINANDVRKLKPLALIFICFFFANALIAVYERATLTRLLDVPMDNEILVHQMEVASTELGDDSFRAFALLGHPLTNANIMAYWSFMLFYSGLLSSKQNIVAFVLGIISMFCFNARGASLLSLFMSIPIIITIIREKSKYRIITFLIIAIAVIYFISFFNSFGGRLASIALDDDSGMVRYLALQEFLSLSTNEYIFGGHKVMYAENGYFMLIECFGLLGLLKAILEIIIAYKVLELDSKVARWIIMLSLIAIGSTNSNLFYASVFPLYILSVVIFVNNKRKEIYESTL